MCAEACATELNITREMQDDYAEESYRRAQKAIKAGRFMDEIVPVTIPHPTKKGKELVVEQDEEPWRINFDKLRTLRTAFKKDGTVTAANASSLNDGAAALVLMSADKAKELGVKPLARIRSFADAAQEPIKFTTAPALAIPIAMKRGGVSTSDVGVWEINEAFSVVSIANNMLLDLNPDIVNPSGGAVAMGHPIGCSGARIVLALAHELERHDASVGGAGICNGGGGASAIILERV
mmetsp:Transcript_5029/g.11069  ORF Transcript_5029/g.11069 Transcript_5029/m.11069 type:complete len:237 (+) Transcript_5029:578-1288(+)